MLFLCLCPTPPAFPIVYNFNENIPQTLNAVTLYMWNSGEEHLSEIRETWAQTLALATLKKIPVPHFGHLEIGPNI